MLTHPEVYRYLTVKECGACYQTLYADRYGQYLSALKVWRLLNDGKMVTPQGYILASSEYTNSIQAPLIKNLRFAGEYVVLRHTSNCPYTKHNITHIQKPRSN